MVTPPDSIATVDGIRRDLARMFRDRGIDTPELDARLIVGHALALDHAALVSAGHRILTPAQTDAIAALAARRLASEPVARILGVKEFWGLPLMLNAETLVPRPDTETIVEAALDSIDHSRRRQARLHIADLGTGSGALLLALLSELPRATGVGTDLSLPALHCARHNAAALALAASCIFVRCSYGEALRGAFDLIVSNPPYIRCDEIAALQPEVALFEPRRALDGGSDGLDAYRAIAADALRLLAPDGMLIVELGAGQHADVAALFTAAGLAVAPPRHDLSGVERALLIKRLA